MKTIASLIAMIALGLTVVPSLLVFSGTIDIELHKTLMLIGCILWFIAAPVWFRKARQENEG